MKNFAPKISLRNNSLALICFTLFTFLIPNISHSQDYRFINAYMNDFEKNEMYIKKSIMDYSVTIVEGQMNSRSQAAAHKIVEKLEIMNGILKTSDRGFEKNTLLRDSFIKMNDKTIECLTKGRLI